MAKVAELKYQQGHVYAAKKLFHELVEYYSSNPIHGDIVHRTATMLQSWKLWEKAHTSENIPSDSLVILNVPVVQKADYLTLNWYGVLSAIAHVRPNLTDLRLKEKLLKIFSLEEHHLPLIENIPAIVPALKRLQVPFHTAFLNDSLLMAALHRGLVSLVYYKYVWIPIVGYDARRDGFLYYDYSSNYHTPSLFRDRETRIIFDTGYLEEEKTERREVFSCRKFICASDLRQHILNIGGIGLVVGDSSFISEKISHAAYLIELGDIYYQTQKNFKMAGKCYQKAEELHWNWTVLERMAYLHRFYHQIQVNSREGANLFSASDYYPPWYRNFNLNKDLKSRILKRVLEGKAGWIILEQWPIRTQYRDSVQYDSLMSIYSFLLQKNPFAGEYLDTLARLEYERGRYSESEFYYEKLSSMYSRRNREINLKLAWVKQLLGKTSEIKGLLSGTRPEFGPARYLTLEGALHLSQGQTKKAYKKLTKSLKEDKTLAETHRLLAEYYFRTGDIEKNALHLKWYNRCKAIL
jgi:tetratricopeptide (TPR) repeat protein